MEDVNNRNLMAQLIVQAPKSLAYLISHGFFSSSSPPHLNRIDQTPKQTSTSTILGLWPPSATSQAFVRRSIKGRNLDSSINKRATDPDESETVDRTNMCVPMSWGIPGPEKMARVMETIFIARHPPRFRPIYACYHIFGSTHPGYWQCPSSYI